MIVTCTRCRALTNVPAVDRIAGVTRCEQCGMELDVAATMNPGSSAPAMSSEPAAPRRSQATPPGFSIEGDPAEHAGYRSAPSPPDLTLVRRNARVRWVVELGLLVLVLAAVIALFVADALWIGSPWIAWAVVPVSAGALVRLRLVLPRVLNRTVVRLGPTHLSVSHGPLPSELAPAEVSLEHLRQLYSVQRPEFDPGRGPYQVRALLRGDVATVLVDGLETPEQALFVEQRLESALSITDRQVTRELRRAEPQDAPAPRALPAELEPMAPLVPPRLLVWLGLATLVSALPAVGLSLHYGASSLAASAVSDTPRSLSFEVSPTHRAVSFVAEVDRVMDFRQNRDRNCSRFRCPDGPSLRYVIVLRRLNGPPRTLRCDPMTEVGVSHHGSPLEHEEWWTSTMAGCTLTLEPGRYEATVHREWASRGRPGDRITKSRLLVEARR